MNFISLRLATADRCHKAAVGIAAGSSTYSNNCSLIARLTSEAVQQTGQP